MPSAYLAYRVHPDHAALVDEAIEWYDGTAAGVERTVMRDGRLPGCAGHPKARGLFYGVGFRELSRDAPLVEAKTAG